MIIKQLNNIYGFNIKTDKLLEEAGKIREALNELNEKTKLQHAKINPEVPRLADPQSDLYL
jgi:predicted ATP-grasp superfamily ATP-dependent carboligase